MSSVIGFGAVGDGKTDNTEAILHALKDGEGLVEFPRGDFLIKKTIEIDTTKLGRIGISGSLGTAKLIMAGPGPAIRIIGNHGGTADPSSMKPDIWKSQRLPTISGLEIEGGHSEADGIELIGTVQAILSNVGLHQLRNGVHLTGRNRNVIIEGCQIYHNKGVGVWLNQLNLHQVNVIGNHISYNRLGGIRIEQSEVRNLQITGNDIEYNNDRSHNLGNEPTAEIYIDTTAERASVNEVTIASNTIQATSSEGGANLRILEKKGEGTGRPPGLYAITGNILGSQENNVHISGGYGITITGNSIYSATKYNLLMEDSQQMIVSSNQFRRHTPAAGTAIKIENSSQVVFSANHILDEEPEGQKSGLPMVHLKECNTVTFSGSQSIATGTSALVAENCSDVLISGCTFVKGEPGTGATIEWTGKGSGNLLTNCRLNGPEKRILNLAKSAGVTERENMIGDK